MVTNHIGNLLKLFRLFCRTVKSINSVTNQQSASPVKPIACSICPPQSACKDAAKSKHVQNKTEPIQMHKNRHEVPMFCRSRSLYAIKKLPRMLNDMKICCIQCWSIHMPIGIAVPIAITKSNYQASLAFIFIAQMPQHINRTHIVAYAASTPMLFPAQIS